MHAKKPWSLVKIIFFLMQLYVKLYICGVECQAGSIQLEWLPYKKKYIIIISYNLLMYVKFISNKNFVYFFIW